MNVFKSYLKVKGGEEVSDERAIEYDHGSSLSFVNSLESICGIMAGFVFTGTTVVLSTLVEPVPLLSQVTLFTLSTAMGMFDLALWELHGINVLTCLHSPKLIIPYYPNRWRIVNTLIGVGGFLELLAVNLLFLLKNMRELFILSMFCAIVSFVWIHYRFRHVLEKHLQRLERYIAKRKGGGK